MKNIKNYNLDELKEEMLLLNEKKYRAEQIFKWIYIDKVKPGNKQDEQLVQYM